MDIPPPPWSSSRLLVFRVFLVWVVLFIISFPVGYTLLPDPGQFTQSLFEPLARWMGQHVFQIKKPFASELISDSTGLWIDLFTTLLLAIIMAIGWGILFRRIRSHNRLLYWFHSSVRYYLALQLFMYAFSKIFKVQFYLPEPNILYSKLGEIPKDLLYWSTMGVSRPYSIFLGFTELIAAILLFFRRTAMAGAFFAFFILVNILAINLSYDISVKLFSCFLLALVVFLLAVDLKGIKYFFGVKQISVSNRWTPSWNNGNKKWLYRIGKMIVIGLILLESLWPYIKAGNFNDDKMARPLFHGAYEVKTFVENGDTLAPMLSDSIRWKRVFFHRQGYFIIEMMDDKMIDIKMSYDTVLKEIYLLAYKDFPNARTILSYQQPGIDDLILEKKTGTKYRIELHKLDWKQMPLLKKEFTWTVDEP